MRKTLIIAPLLLLLCAGVAFADADWDAGVTAFKAGKYSEAAAAFQKYVEKMPDAYQGHQMLGQALLQSKQYGQAATHLQKANELKGGDAAIQLVLGCSSSGPRPTAGAPGSPTSRSSPSPRTPVGPGLPTARPRSTRASSRAGSARSTRRPSSLPTT
jgi:TolA-binding protein